MEIPKFEKKEELFQYLKKNETQILETKKSAVKHADGLGVIVNSGVVTNKALNQEDRGVLRRRLVINTTNWLDSHKDVHIDGLWDEDLKSNPPEYLLKEHKFEFDNMITKEIEPKVVTYKWSDLGRNSQGTTQALVFDANIRKEDNADMYNKYRKGYVKNHSVGMMRKEVFLAINSDLEEYKENKAYFDLYYDRIENKEAVDALGYFYAVTKAVAVEGSAVPIGSNIMTPTMEIKEDIGTSEKSLDYDDLKEFYKLISL